MIAQACRHFGQSPDYWEDALTMRRLEAQQSELAENPPPETFLAAYFMGRYGWRSPAMQAAASGEPEPLAQPDAAKLPEFED